MVAPGVRRFGIAGWGIGRSGGGLFWGLGWAGRVREHGIGGIVGAFLTAVFATTAVPGSTTAGLLAGNAGVLGRQLMAVLAVAAYLPPLDVSGSSVRGQHVCEGLIRRLGLHLFASPGAHAGDGEAAVSSA